MMTMEFNTVEATRTVAKALQTFKVAKADLVAKFPTRPASQEDVDKMVAWVQARTLPATEGMYRTLDGRIFKVVHALYGSGRLYAKVLDMESMKFIMAVGAIRHLTLADRLTLDEAREFGKLYGVCVRCAAPLTDEASIERGMGPVCMTKI